MMKTIQHLLSVSTLAFVLFASMTPLAHAQVNVQYKDDVDTLGNTTSPGIFYQRRVGGDVPPIPVNASEIDVIQRDRAEPTVYHEQPTNISQQDAFVRLNVRALDDTGIDKVMINFSNNRNGRTESWPLAKTSATEWTVAIPLQFGYNTLRYSFTAYDLAGKTASTRQFAISRDRGIFDEKERVLTNKYSIRRDQIKSTPYDMTAVSRYVGPIRPDREIRIPQPRISPPQPRRIRPVVSTRTYTVRPGDTLGTVSKFFYGTIKRWKDIFDANRGVLQSPDVIFSGQVLREA